jgi:tetratricopeptide (TPR) repeat protein
MPKIRHPKIQLHPTTPNLKNKPNEDCFMLRDTLDLTALKAQTAPIALKNKFAWVSCVFLFIAIVLLFTVPFANASDPFVAYYYKNGVWDEYGKNCLLTHSIETGEGVWLVDNSCQRVLHYPDYDNDIQYDFSEWGITDKTARLDLGLVADVDYEAMWGAIGTTVVRYNGIRWLVYPDALLDTATSMTAVNGKFMAIGKAGVVRYFNGKEFVVIGLPNLLPNGVTPSLAGTDESFWLAYQGLWRFDNQFGWDNVIASDDALAPVTFLDNHDNQHLLWRTATDVVLYDVVSRQSQAFPSALIGIDDVANIVMADVNNDGNITLTDGKNVYQYYTTSRTWEVLPELPTQLPIRVLNTYRNGNIVWVSSYTEEAYLTGDTSPNTGNSYIMPFLAILLAGALWLWSRRRISIANQSAQDILQTLYPDLPAPEQLRKSKQKNITPAPKKRWVWVGLTIILVVFAVLMSRRFGFGLSVGFVVWCFAITGLMIMSIRTWGQFRLYPTIAKALEQIVLYTIVLGIGLMILGGFLAFFNANSSVLIPIAFFVFLFVALITMIGTQRAVNKAIFSGSLAQGKFEQALSEIEAMRRLQDAPQHILAMKALVYLEWDKLDEAQEYAHEGLVWMQDTHTSIGLLILGQVELAKEHDESALAHFEGAIRLAPAFHLAYLELANWYNKTEGDPQRALEILEMVAPNPADSLHNQIFDKGVRAIAYARAEQAQLADMALLNLEKLILPDQNLHLSYLSYVKGRVAETSGDTTTARHHYQETTRLLPDSYNARLARERERRIGGFQG